MSIIIDLAIVLIMALCIFFGYRKGLIGVAFKILSFLIAFIVAITLSYPISNFIINNTEIATGLETSIQGKFVSETGEPVDIDQEAEIKAEDSFSQEILNSINGTANDMKNQTVQVVSHNLALLIVRAVVSIGLFIITKFILFFFRKIAETIAEIPIIKQFNKAGGIIYGVIKGLLVVYVILALASLLAPTLNNTDLIVSINKSFIGNMMYNNNILLKIIL